MNFKDIRCIMIKSIIIVLAGLFLFSCATYKEIEKPIQEGYVVKGYIPEWNRWTADDVEGDKLTELIISFALVRNGKINPSKIKEHHLKEIDKLRITYPDLKITFALGGWGADGFSDAVLTEESREIFVNSIVEYMIEKGFDGMDLDWEFPVNGGWGSIKARPEDRINHTEFLYLLREKMNRAGNIAGKYLSLSVAANSGSDYINEWVEIEKVAAVVDYLHIMTYDEAGPWSGKTMHHSNGGFTENTVLKFLEAGVPSNKIVIGGAFYGKLMSGINFEAGEPLGAPFSDSFKSRDIDYTLIKKNYLNNPKYISGWDARESEGRSPYIWSEEEGIFITYDDPRSIKDKCDTVKKYNLAGAMFWDYTQDKTGDLITVFAEELLQ